MVRVLKAVEVEQIEVVIKHVVSEVGQFEKFLEADDIKWFNSQLRGNGSLMDCSATYVMDEINDMAKTLTRMCQVADEEVYKKGFERQTHNLFVGYFLHKAFTTTMVRKQVIA